MNLLSSYTATLVSRVRISVCFSSSMIPASKIIWENVKGAAVSHGRFGSVHLKNAVVDTEREERGKDMLHGENFRVSPFQRRCAECICHKFALCRHFRGTGKIDTPEDDAAARRSGTHRDCYGNSGMESVSLKGNRFSEGILISFSI